MGALLSRSGILQGSGWWLRMTSGMALLGAFLLGAMPASAEDTGALSGTAQTSQPSMMLTAGAGLAVYSGDFSQLYSSGSIGYTVDASVMGQVTDAPLYAGVDFGLNFWGFNAPVVPGAQHSINAVGVQVLPTAVYRFSIDSNPKLVPYFGFAVGPNFYFLRDVTVRSAQSSVNSSTDTHVYLEILSRPGIEYHFSDNVAFAFEPKLGLLNFSFIFLPVANLSLTL